MDATHSKPAPFLDWSNVWSGAVAYENDGRAWVSEAPRGVRLSVQQAEKSQPVLVSDRPWEGPRLAYATALYAEGRYQMWYGTSNGLCYAESTDGFTWRKPVLNLYERDGSTANNVVYPKLIEGSVFRDPQANDAERYKLVNLDVWQEYQGKAVRGSEAIGRLKNELLAQGLNEGQIYGMALQLKGAVLGAVSPDGLHWTTRKEPLFVHFADTQNVVLFDQELAKYVGYFRFGPGGLEPDGRRSITRAETDDFWHWPLPQIVLQPDCQDPPTDDYYTNAYTPYPGGGFHLMFPAIYHRTRDVLDVRLAVSRDGFNWSWPGRGAIIPLSSEASGESGSIYACPGILPLGEDRWGVLYRATNRRHNEHDPQDISAVQGHYAWAMWKRDRLVALEACDEGRVTLNKRRCHGERMVLNHQTARDGWIRVELIEPALWPPGRVEPLEGHSFADCEPLRGDSLAGEVRWKGSADLSAFAGRDLCARVELSRAKLFSIQL